MLEPIHAGGNPKYATGYWKKGCYFQVVFHVADIALFILLQMAFQFKQIFLK
jgi:hypothetical protein